MTYQMRFRNRNQTTPIGRRKKDNFGLVSGTCQNAPQYGWTSGGDTGTLNALTKVDTIDDVAGDPPQRKLGTAGFKFHPLTRVTSELIGDGSFNWRVRGISPICTGGAEKFESFRECTGLSASLLWSGLAFPMDGEHLRLDLMPMPNEKIAQLKDLAETACLAKRGKYGESNLYESLAEIDKTLSMAKDILHRARRIQDTAFFGAKGSSRARQFTNEAAGQYLATRYGFAPLVKDLEAILVGLEKPLGKITQRSIASEQWQSQQTTLLPDRIDADTVVFGETKTVKHSLYVKAISLDSAEVNVLQRLGLGWKDFISVPWELLGYSFVADWFANFGDVISGMVPDIGISHIGACTVVRWECEETVSWLLKGLAAGAGTSELLSANAPGPITRKTAVTIRTTGLPSPRLQWRSDFKFDNATRVLDAVSLFTARAAKVRSALAPTRAKPIARLKSRNWKDEAGISRQQGIRSADQFYG